MGKTKKLNHKAFRYLTKKEFKDPLYAIAKICRQEISLYEYWRVITKLIRASTTCSPKWIKTIKASNLTFYCRQIMRNIELLFVVKQRFNEWGIDPNSSHFSIEFGRSNAWIEDDTLFNGTTLYFKRLKKEEILNMDVFLTKFFQFKSLRKWYKLMDDLHSTLFSESRLSEYFAYETEDHKIFKNLEKLIEATFLIYEIKAKEHIFKHYVKEFFLEKYLEKEDPEVGDEPLAQDILASENPAPDETDDDT